MRGGRCPDCKSSPVDGASLERPSPVGVLAAFLDDWRRMNDGEWAYNLPLDPNEAAAWWINTMQEPCRKWEQSRLEQTRPRRQDELPKKYWVTPYIDRLKYTLKRYLTISHEEQEIVYGCAQDKVFWRGEPVSMFYGSDHSVYEETLRMREMGMGDYKTEARQRVRALFGTSVKHG